MSFRREFSAFGSNFALVIDSHPGTEWIQKILPFYDEAILPGLPVQELKIVSLRNQGGNGLFYKNERLCGLTGFDQESAEGIEGMIQFVVARNALPDFVFVHGGAVAVDKKGVLLPASTNCGKTTLTKALLDLGADYFSDDCTVIDRNGRLHPYPTPLKLRRTGSSREWIQAPDIDSAKLRGPVDIECIIFTEFSGVEEFSPSRILPGEAMMGLMSNLFLPTLIRYSPETTLRSLAKAVEGATLLSGPRGEAMPVAKKIVSLLRELEVSSPPAT